MAIFKYRAKNFKGEEISSEMEAPSMRDVALRVKNDGYVLLDVAVSTSQGKGARPLEAVNHKQKAGGLNFQFFKHVKLDEKMMFTRNLAVMIGAGLPVARALEGLSRETKNEYFRTVIQDILAKVKKGNTLKDSFSAHPKVFSSLFLAMVEAGEQSGKLEDALNVLARHMKADHELIRRIRGALTYPAVILVVMFFIGMAMMVFVVPILISTFEDIGVKIPATTLAVVWISDFLRSYWLFVLLAIPLAGFGFLKAARTVRGKHVLDTIFVRAPLIGTIDRQFNTARTARTLSSLLMSGVSFTEALGIASRVLQNHFYKDVLMEAREKIQKGGKISDVFAKYPNLYSSLLAEMVAVGEETGKVSDMLAEVAEFYEGEVDSATKNLSTVLEPILMVVIGVAVGFFAISMIQPLYSVMSGL